MQRISPDSNVKALRRAEHAYAAPDSQAARNGLQVATQREARPLQPRLAVATTGPAGSPEAPQRPW
jgi:hypothetical protein